MMRARRIILQRATAILVLTVVYLAAGIGVREWWMSRRTYSYDFAVPVPNWRAMAKGHAMGPAEARVTIVEFADFQCPSCARAEHEVRRLRQHYPHDVRLVYRHLPLEMHPYAATAAVASECAAAAGAFEPFHDILFDQQSAFGQKRWSQFAAEAGIRDTVRFNGCMRDSAVWVARVAADRASADSLGLAGTPTFIINGRSVLGYPGNGALTQQVEIALGSSASHR